MGLEEGRESVPTAMSAVSVRPPHVEGDSPELPMMQLVQWTDDLR
jgi:hypothetical protein